MGKAKAIGSKIKIAIFITLINSGARLLHSPAKIYILILKIQIGNISFQVDGSSQKMFWDYVNLGKWEPYTFDIIDEFVSADSCVVDIGCWIGPLSLYLAKKGAIVYSLDPDPEAYKWFIKNLNLNPDLKNRIHPQNIAISNTGEEQILYARTGYGNSSTSMLKRTRDRIAHSTSKACRLDEFLETNLIDKVDFLKIDIEGGEFAIIDQLKELKAIKKYDCLFLSLHYNHLNEAVYQKKVRFRLLSLVLMKLERITGQYLFKKELLRYLKSVIALSQKFNFIYAHNGRLIPFDKLTPLYLLNQKVDLLLSDDEWNRKKKQPQ